MKSVIASVLFLSATAFAFAGDTNALGIVPLPEKMERHEGSFKVKAGSRIFVDAAAGETGEYLAMQLRKSTGYGLAVSTSLPKTLPTGSILLTTKDAKSELGDEGYELSVTPASAIIRAKDSAGLFYGVQTLLQLLPPEVFAAKKAAGAKWEIPCVQIEDQPRFKWRGMMLDVGRHFFDKEEVKQILDGMALHKLNRFHWHLVDDQGWRIEIKKYPRLTEMGAWRKATGFGLDPKASTAYGPDGRYGGYYTQADIREVVAYAAARHIAIVPEIEMPGHASAALKAYPQLSCTGGPFTTDLPGGVFNGVFCAGNDEAFAFIQDVLTEVFQLFPGQDIHVGGDEVLIDNWKHCAKCQARIQQEGLKGPQELESYFIRRVEKFVNANGRNLVGWSEIREGGLAQNAIVMDWVGGATEAASAGHDVVMSPLADCYFDHYQSKDLSTEPHAIGGYLPLSQVYAFEPMPEKLEPQYRVHILGAQANVWTEYMPSLKHVEYMVFPRLCALSEVVWSPKNSRDWNGFNQRLEIDCRRLDQLGINYRFGPEEVVKADSSK
ncbi:MAG: exo 1 [Pedosphaera sp.]|nr:exo 1 [Pedosphaera sp.]